MSFVTQDDVFAAIEPVLHGVFETFARGRSVTPAPFPRIAYREAMLKYGSDKPDLRNPVVIADVSEAFRGSGFGIFAKAVEAGSVVRRSEEHTSELQSLLRISYAVFCLKKKKNTLLHNR